MNIQPSVLIWTVICFCAFAFIINTLLFKPVLKIMDKRREKIEKAKSDSAAFEKKMAENQKALEEQRLKAKQELAERQKAVISEFEEKSEAELKNMHAEMQNALLDKRSELLAEKEQNQAIVFDKMDDFVAAFTDKLISYR